MSHPVYRWSWARRRLVLGLKAGLGAVYACAWTPLIALASFIPFSTPVYIAVEVAWWFIQRRKWQQLDTLAFEAQAQPAEVVWATFRRVVQGMDELQLDTRAWLTSWFKGAHVQDIHREDVRAFLASALWCSNRAQVEAAGFSGDLDAMASELEAWCSVAARHPLNVPSIPDAVGGLVADSRALPVRGPVFRFQAGSNANVAFYEQHTQPLPHWYRPLCVYLAFEFMAWMNETMLIWAGFKHHRKGCVEYFTYGMPHTSQPLISSRGSQQDLEDPLMPPDDQSSTASGPQPPTASSAPGMSGAQKPLVVLHGVGMGILPYIKLLLTLASTGAPVIAVEYKHVGQRWCHHVPSLDELRDAVLSIMAAHGCGPQQGGAHLVAHSFGTLIASAVQQSQPQAVSSLALLDPICFHMWLPSLLINFIYRPLTILDPRTPAAHRKAPRGWLARWLGPWWGTAMSTALPRPGVLLKDLMILGPAREMHCSAALCRLLDWRQASMWSEDVPARCIIALAGCDELLPAPLIADWARSHTPAKVMIAPQLRHADVLVTGAVLDPLVAQIYHLAYEQQQQEEEQQLRSVAPALLEATQGMAYADFDEVAEEELLHVCGTHHAECYTQD